MANSKKFPYRLIEQADESNKLAIVLPGAGYTTQAPLLHFATGIFYKKGFDLLHINYAFNREEMSVLNESDFAKDVQQAIENAIKDKKYSNYYIVAKSIGTKALSYLLRHPMLKDASVVWLTPILQNDGVINALVNTHHQGLCIVGDKDGCYIEERFEKLKNKENLLLQVIKDGNHSLELHNDPIKSIEVLKNVISAINEFIPPIENY